MKPLRAIAHELNTNQKTVKQLLVGSGVINSQRLPNPTALMAGVVEVRYVRKGMLSIPTNFYDTQFVQALMNGTGVKFDPVPEPVTVADDAPF